MDEETAWKAAAPKGARSSSLLGSAKFKLGDYVRYALDSRPIMLVGVIVKIEPMPTLLYRVRWLMWSDHDSYLYEKDLILIDEEDVALAVLAEL